MQQDSVKSAVGWRVGAQSDEEVAPFASGDIHVCELYVIVGGAGMIADEV